MAGMFGLAGLASPLFLLGVPPALAMAHRHRIRKAIQRRKQRKQAAANRARAAQQRQQNRKQGAADRPAPAPAAAGPAPAPAGPQRHPRLRLVSKDGKAVMSASGMSELADNIKQVVGGFRPDNKEQVEDFYRGIPEVMAALTQGFHQAADNMGEEHIHDQVTETTHELANNISGATDAADEVFKEHLDKHRIWLS